MRERVIGATISKRTPVDQGVYQALEEYRELNPEILVHQGTLNMMP